MLARTINQDMRELTGGELVNFSFCDVRDATTDKSADFRSHNLFACSIVVMFVFLLGCCFASLVLYLLLARLVSFACRSTVLFVFCSAFLVYDSERTWGN